MLKAIQYKPFGDKAILVTWENKIAPEIINDITKFQNKIVIHKKDELHDIIIGYNSLVLKYKSTVNFIKEIEQLKGLYVNVDEVIKTSKILWEIPVCYDVEFGFDLPETAKKLGLSKEEVIERHCSNLYTVYFIGFLPGFLYLGGLNEKLQIDRKSTPLLKVPKGSVAIGGKQTGIYPQESAGGWHVIGRTPIDFFNIEKEIPCFAKSGDQLRFKPISIKEFKRIEIEMSLSQYELTKSLIHD